MSIPDGIELMIIITATFAQALSGSGPGVNIVYVLVVWRFIMGVGVGGDYPLSAVIASEFASTSSRGRLMTAVFASQGWGNLGTTASFPAWKPVTPNPSYDCSCLPSCAICDPWVQRLHHCGQLQ